MYVLLVLSLCVIFCDGNLIEQDFDGKNEIRFGSIDCSTVIAVGALWDPEQFASKSEMMQPGNNYAVRENETMELVIELIKFFVVVLIVSSLVISAQFLLKKFLKRCKGFYLSLFNQKVELRIDEKAESNVKDKELCAICFTNYRKCALQCGHYLFCFSCSDKLTTCPICHEPVKRRIKIYS